MQNRCCLGRTTPFDALLCWKGVSHTITWDYATKASIRKLLDQTSEEYECSVCYEKIEQFKGTICPQCACLNCAVCRIKMGLTAENQRQIKSGDFLLITKRVECRVDSMVDVRLLCPQVMDRLAEFNADQQAVLKFIKENDPRYEQNYARQQIGVKETKQIMARQFGKGKRVKIHGLKSKKWNGLQVIIIGERIVKDDGTIRWPVQSSDGSKSKASIKQCNLRKLF